MVMKFATRGGEEPVWFGIIHHVRLRFNEIWFSYEIPQCDRVPIFDTREIRVVWSVLQSPSLTLVLRV